LSSLGEASLASYIVSHCTGTTWIYISNGISCCFCTVHTDVLYLYSVAVGRVYVQVY